MLKKILINILLIITCIGLAEFWCFYKTKEENKEIIEQYNKATVNSKSEYSTKYRILKPYNFDLYSNSYYINNTDKKSILWLGCSFANGALLDEKNTPCYKISQISKRNCINKSKGATGTQFMYYQLKNIQSSDDVEYVIYTFIWNHLQRLYNFQVGPIIDVYNLRYREVNGELEEIKPVFLPLYSSFLVKNILKSKAVAQQRRESIKFDLFNAIMKESVKISKEKFPNSKFIMIEFVEYPYYFPLPDYEIKKLEEMGIIVVKYIDFAKDTNIFDRKYWLKDNVHPSAEAWDLILPKLNELYLK